MPFKPPESPLLKLGSQGTEVTNIQKALAAKGFLDESIRYGTYGVETKKAVLKAQEAYRMDSTGEWDPKLTEFVISNQPPIPDPSTSIQWERTNSEGQIDPNYNPNSEAQRKVRSLPKGKGHFVVDPIPCFIINLRTGTRIVFKYETPESISESVSANFGGQETIGRSSPYQPYSSSGPRSISFGITLIADYCEEGIVQTVNKLKALTYPHKSGRVVSPLAKFVLGDFIDVNVIVNSVSVEWEKPYKDDIYTKAEVSFDLTEVVAKSQFDVNIEM